MIDIQSYQLTLWAAVAIGILLIVQLLIADFAGIRAGHKAGTPIAPDSSNFLFRAARAHANTNESISAFALFALVGVLSGTDPLWLGSLAWFYVAARIAHMMSYYANRKLPRSSAFALSLIALGGMFTTIAVGAVGT